MMGINTYCDLTVPQWVSSAGCSSFTSSLEFYNSQGVLVGQLTLSGEIGQGFYLEISNSTVESMAIYPEFPDTEGFTLILQYSYGMFQLSSVFQGLPITTITFAYAIPPWGLEVYGVRTSSGSNALTSSTWMLNECSSSTTLDIEPYVPPVYSNPILRTPLLNPQPCLSTPLTNGGVAYVTVYPSMSGSCLLGLFFDVIIPDSSMHVMSIMDGLAGNQTIYWDNQVAYTGNAFIDKHQPTVIWFAVNAAGYMFVGTSDPNHGLKDLVTALPNPLTLASTSTFHACTRTSDWTVSALNWMPMIESCTFPNLDLDGGQSIIFNYTLTYNNPLSACSDDLSAVVLGHVDSAVWVALTSATRAIIYGCIDNGCFSIYVIIGVYMSSINNTIYVPLCNVTVLNAYIGGFMWSVLGSSITYPQVTIFSYPYLCTHNHNLNNLNNRKWYIRK